jgi:hypothetical protein
MTEGKFFWLAGVIVAALILSSCVAQVAPEDWLYLGKRNVNFDAVGRQNLFPGGDRLFIDLPGGERTVREVIFRYSKLPGKHKTVTVELYGR